MSQSRYSCIACILLSMLNQCYDQSRTRPGEVSYTRPGETDFFGEPAGVDSGTVWAWIIGPSGTGCMDHWMHIFIGFLPLKMVILAFIKSTMIRHTYTWWVGQWPTDHRRMTCTQDCKWLCVCEKLHLLYPQHKNRQWQILGSAITCFKEISPFFRLLLSG